VEPVDTALHYGVNVLLEMQAMAADPQHFSKLIASVAPRVIDMDNVKKGLLCQLFGGVSKSTAAALGGDTTSR
jgi:DNA replicative helicase MCM subunit Mcm2 (Cdc46/Mcm family)